MGLIGGGWSGGETTGRPQGGVDDVADYHFASSSSCQDCGRHECHQGVVRVESRERRSTNCAW